MIVKGHEKEGLIKIDNARVYGLEESIIASGYPKQLKTYEMAHNAPVTNLVITDKDNKRVKHLGSATPGSGHDCFLKGIIIQFDMQVSEYIWRQWDRYHFNDYVSSQSKMHRILKLDIDENCNKYVLGETVDNLNELIEAYNNFEDFKNELLEFGDDDNYIKLRNGDCVEISKDELFNMIVANVPCGMMLTARVTLNYLQAKSMKLQRKHHKMEEWHCICDFFDSLPKFKELTDSK